MTLSEPGKQFDIRINLNSSLAPGTFDIQKLYLSYIGNNFPCLSQTIPATYFNQ